jgi:CheY-like chemotaxis protein
MFEEAGDVAYAAADWRQAVALTERLLPDVVVAGVHVPDTLAPDTLALVLRLATDARTSDIPVVMVTSSPHSDDAGRVRDAGGVTVLAPAAEIEELVGAVETLIAAAPHVPRTLQRRRRDLQALARFYPPDEDGQPRLRRLIDRWEVAIVAVDEQGHCMAASRGARQLTGYSHRQLMIATVFDAGGRVSDADWRAFLTHSTVPAPPP